MKKILSILIISLVFLSSYAQTEAGFLKDAKNNFVKVGTSSTEFLWSDFPPDTIIDHSFEMGETGGSFTSLLTEIKSYWTLEEAAGNAIDSVGTADLPIYGAITREQAGKIGDCYSFAGASYLGPIDTYFEFNGSFHIGCWFSTTSSSAWETIMSCFGATNYGWELITVGDPTKVIYWRMRYSGGDETIVGTTDINDGAWYRVDASYNAVDDTMKLYINGVLEGSTENVNGTWYSSETYFHIGSRLGGGYFNGKIDEPAVWNKELTQDEVDSLFSEVQYPFPGQGSGGDSLRMLTNGYDPRIDSVIVNWNYEGDGWPTDEEDGTVKFAFPVADTALYNDTIFPWPGLKDTIILLTTWSGINDVWTVVPNKYNILIDSSDIYPPPQDYPGIWDTIEYYDFENHTGLPKEYTLDLFIADGWNAINDWRASDHRYTVDWQGICVDSIIVDPISGSNVLKLNHKDTIIDGRDCQGSGTSGDTWKSQLDNNYTELYISFNVMLRPGWLWSAGGKFGPGPAGGTDPPHGTGPEYGEGFTAQIVWHWDDRNNLDWAGMLYHYLYYNGQENEWYGETNPWQEFNPVGDGTLHYNNKGQYIFGDGGDAAVVDSVWVNITTRCVVNTFTGATPNYDGIMEAYVNGYLIGQLSGLYLITYPDKDKNMDWWYFSHFFGGGGPALRDEWALMDDVWIFTYDVSVDVPRGNELSEPGRILSLPNWPKQVQE